MSSYSLQEGGVYIGRWTDYSNGNQLVTLPIRSAGYLISANTVFINFVSSCVWSLVKFFVHRRLASIDMTDGPGLFFRVLFRNTASDLETLSDIRKIWWAWRSSKPRAHKITRRALGLAIPAVVHLLIFSAAGVLSSKIAGQDYESNHVRLKSHNCGYIAWNYSLTGADRDQMLTMFMELELNDTQAGRQYAHDCYPIGSNTAQCSMFPSRSIPYDTDNVDCPFGQDSTNKSLCRTVGNQAIRLMTPLLNTNAMFGINVPKKDQIAIRKALTCSPIEISSYTRITDAGLDNETMFLDLGPIISQSRYTVAYKTRSKNDFIGYQLYSMASGAGGVWSPIDVFKKSHGDISINVLAGNSITYRQQVEDPWFSADIYTPTPFNPTAYQSDNDLSALACVDQSQICNAAPGSSSKCTILGSGDDMDVAYSSIGLNKPQLATVERILPTILLTSTWMSLNLQGAGALLASRRVMGLLSPGLPDNQWQLEVQDWFETSLAAIQAATVRYVNNVNQAAPGEYGSISTVSLYVTDNYFCDKQRVRNTGSYVSFSFLGLLFLYIVGSAFILISCILEPALGWFRKTRSPRDIVRIADQKLQLTRKSLIATGYSDKEWDNRLDEIPVTRGDQYFSLPQSQTLDGKEDYCPTKPGESTIGTAIEAEDLDQQSDHDDNKGTAGNKDWLLRVEVEEQPETGSLMSEIQQSLDHQRRISSSRYSRTSASTE